MPQFTAHDAAMFMAERMLADGHLHQREIAPQVNHYFGDRFARPTEAGGFSIDGNVREIFRNLLPPHDWDKPSSSWYLFNAEDGWAWAELLRGAHFMSELFREQAGRLSHAEAAGMLLEQCGVGAVMQSPSGALCVSLPVRRLFGVLQPGAEWSLPEQAWHAAPGRVL